MMATYDAYAYQVRRKYVLEIPGLEIYKTNNKPFTKEWALAAINGALQARISLDQICFHDSPPGDILEPATGPYRGAHEVVAYSTGEQYCLEF